jgi:DNA-binding SARP family transcriptional activator
LADLRIELLGGFRVTVGTRPVPETAWRRRKPAALLKLLALAPGHRLQREQAMELLWPELDPTAAAANLRKALHHARRALDQEDALLIVSRGELLCLPSDRVWVDVQAFFAAVAHARRRWKASRRAHVSIARRPPDRSSAPDSRIGCSGLWPRQVQGTRRERLRRSVASTSKQWQRREAW